MKRRGIVLGLILLALVSLSAVMQVVQASAPPSTSAAASATPTATPSPAESATKRAVVAAIARVERTFNAGDVRLLCRPGALVDPAVVRTESGGGDGCESQLETLIASEAPMQLTVREVTLRPDLATAVVATRGGATASVDLVRGPHGWLLSFSDGVDPMPALAGTA